MDCSLLPAIEICRSGYLPGDSSAKFAVNGTSISSLDGNAAQFPFNINIPKISYFKRQTLGGHQVKVQYNTRSIFGFTPEELRVKATFKREHSTFYLTIANINRFNLRSQARRRVTITG